MGKETGQGCSRTHRGLNTRPPQQHTSGPKGLREQMASSSESSAARGTEKEHKKGSLAKDTSNPLLQHRPVRAELVWDGKYDANGRRAAPLRVALPFQTVETVNESVQDRQRGFLFGPGFREEEWRNRLIWGDKKYVLPSLLPEFAGKVNLIYIDPPFDTGADFSFTATVPDEPESHEDAAFTFTKEPSIIEQKAYRDTWGRGLESYLQWLSETAILLHQLLHENGSLFMHLDSNAAHYAKVILDEIFGGENFRNEIIWKRRVGMSSAVHESNRFGICTDSILFYAKSEKTPFSVQYNKETPEYQEYIRTRFTMVDESGRRFQPTSLVNPGYRPNLIYDYKGYKPPPNGWMITKEKMQQWDREGRLYFPETKEGRIRRKSFADELKGMPIQNLWTDIPEINSQAEQRLGYPTQKPEGLLERILNVGSNSDELVLDCFCGSGTTAAVAEKIGRRWIVGDLSRFAIHTTRKRLLSISNVHPFIIQNLGKYERQMWAGAEFGDNEVVKRQRAYIEFILKLAQATPLNGYTWLHGVKGGRMIHVGAVDAPVSVGDISQIAAEFKRAIGTGKDAPKTNGIDVLGWDFAFEVNEVAKQQAAAANIQMRFLRIPRDVMDKRAVEQGDIKFFELAALSVEVKTNKRNVFLKLKDFVIPPDDVPEDARKAVKHWSQWIDYWAVDWDNRSDTFHNEWQTYRTRKDRSLELEIAHSYADPGEYTIVVKVIDILGNDTTKTVKVKVV
jgi:adenine-specific DNA-methyltransferase